MSKVSYVTEEGLKKLKDDLDYLINVERPSISRQIGEARDKGDLSENAEYDAAKDAQGMLEMKISKLQDIISNSRLIDESKLDTSKIQILSKVKIINLKTKQILQYTLVSETEADLKNGKMSINTPIAKGLLGKKVGETVQVTVPSGELSFEILDISL
ncbi:MAG: transcription elongation factor GreA [Bacteroidetes bacterium GWF2_38_335]|nr:MAG: transcription elongation factor GreA [Bacteroidetes bacterium GWF2_38_335]OFY80667.1 MAG: transcription elongation factor GreA [Bacteroidetes bacterium RIFOXYA12_FULL_38_20]HBS87010.1 transcription elongation factor GreA [Bacteroidales bacterium]